MAAEHAISFKFRALVRVGVSCAAIALLLNSCAEFGTSIKDREKAHIFLQLAADQFSQRQYEPAIQSTRKALEHDPDFAPAYNQLGIIYMETKRYSKSEDAFKKALRIDPKYSEVYNNLGVLENKQSKYREAIQDFNLALTNDHYATPENALTNLGYSYFRLGELAKARAYHQKALDISPNFCLANKNMGDVYAKQRNFQKAAEFFRRAVTTCPLYEESQYKLGIVLMKLGHKNVARAQFEQIVKQHQNGPYSERSSELLKYLP